MHTAELAYKIHLRNAATQRNRHYKEWLQGTFLLRVLVLAHRSDLHGFHDITARNLQLLSEIGYFHASIQVYLPVFWQCEAIRLNGPLLYVWDRSHSTLITNAPTTNRPPSQAQNCPRLRQLL